MTRDDMIEKAARAIDPRAWSRDHIDEWSSARLMSWRIAEAALAAVCPGLLAGTHWEAPMEATEGMATAPWHRINDYELPIGKGGSFAPHFAAMRDAYLAEKKG